MSSSWAEFWNTNIVGGTTINEIATPTFGQMGFLWILYLTVVVSVPAFLFLSRKSNDSLSRSVVYAFLITGFLFSLRMDLNWLSMLRSDAQRFIGKTEDERLRLMASNDFHEFLESLKKKLPEGARFRDVENKELSDQITTGKLEAEQVDLITYVYLKTGKYYLLPKETSRDGRFVWVFAPMRARFDAENMVLDVNSHTFKVRSYELFTDKAALFEIME